MTPLISATLLRAQSDRRLVQLVQAGHEAAFTTIVERYRPQLARYCLHLLPEGRVDDALQLAFLQAWRALCEGRDVHELRPWLYTIVHNTAISQLRTGVFDYVELLDTVQSFEEEPAEDLERRAVMRQTLSAVAALPERQREALLAVALEGRPQAQIATEMGLTENGLRQLLFRARTTLRTAATALTPLPMLDWLLRGGGIVTAPGGLGDHVAEATAGAGAVGGANVVGAGTALVVAGTLAVTGTATLGGSRAPERSAAGGPTPSLVAAASPTRASIVTTAAPRARRHGHVLRATATVRHRGTVTRTSRRAKPRLATLRGERGLRVAAGAAPVIAIHPVTVFAAPETAVLEAEPAAVAPPAPVASAATAPSHPEHQDGSGDAADGADHVDGDGGDADHVDGGDRPDGDASDGGDGGADHVDGGDRIRVQDADGGSGTD